jgi:hypothetical protein
MGLFIFKFYSFTAGTVGSGAVVQTVHPTLESTVHICHCRIFCISHLILNSANIKVYISVIVPIVLYGCETWSLIQ